MTSFSWFSELLAAVPSQYETIAGPNKSSSRAKLPTKPSDFIDEPTQQKRLQILQVEVENESSTAHTVRTLREEHRHYPAT